jgi:hypothetical protein
MFDKLLYIDGLSIFDYVRITLENFMVVHHMDHIVSKALIGCLVFGAIFLIIFFLSVKMHDLRNKLKEKLMVRHLNNEPLGRFNVVSGLIINLLLKIVLPIILAVSLLACVWSLIPIFE